MNRAGGVEQSEQTFRALLEAAPDAIVIVNQSGEVVLVNSQAERLFRYARADLIGQPLERLVPDRLRSQHAQHRQRFFEEPRLRPMGAGLDLLGVRSDGTEFPVEISLSPLQTGDGLLVMSAIRDVTERKKTERALQEAIAELESFAYSISHDLRTPLRAIDGFSQALVEDFSDILPGEAREHLGFIREGARRMTALIDDLLSFSRLSRQPLRAQPVEMTDLVESVLKDLRSAGPADVTVHPLPVCSGDPALLRQVWVNLLGNALKYSKVREAPRIEVGGEVEGDLASYYVKDNGIGFDMQFVDKLFRVFQRLHTPDQYEGTGVGLAIVERIVRRHGGRVRASGELGKGATFGFSLPLPGEE
jgi:PAS domain S-box-containing protein